MSLFILLRFLLGCLENPDLENSDLRPKNPDPPNLENSDPPPYQIRKTQTPQFQNDAGPLVTSSLTWPLRGLKTLPAH